MKVNVRVLKRAQTDLEEIHRYLERNSDAADRVLEDLLQALERLRDFPESGARPQDAHLRALGFRCLVSGRYVTLYKATRSNVRIYRVLHQRKAWDRLL